MSAKKLDNMLRVSVIVPCFNQAQFLDECLNSVFEQTYQFLECIIINDGSNDHTEQIAKKWIERDKRFKYFYQENRGLSSARNEGLRFANGDFVQFLDADDLIESEKIKVQVEILLNDPEIDISVSGYRYFEESSLILKAMGKNKFFPEVVLYKNDSDTVEVLKVKNPMVISAPLYRRSVFDAVGFFDEELVSLEDWDFHTRCALHGMRFQHLGINKSTRTLVRLHSGSMMRNDEIMRRGAGLFYKKRNENSFYRQHFPDSETKKEGVIFKSKSKVFKSFLKLFVPPVFLVIKRKLF